MIDCSYASAPRFQISSPKGTRLFLRFSLLLQKKAQELQSRIHDISKLRLSFMQLIGKQSDIIPASDPKSVAQVIDACVSFSLLHCRLLLQNLVSNITFDSLFFYSQGKFFLASHPQMHKKSKN